MTDLPAATERRVRLRLLTGAAELLAREGLVADLLGQASAAAGCAVDHARVYFRRDAELVLALYARFAADLEARVLELPPGTVAERFHAAMTARLELVGPYRQALAMLTATLLDPHHELGVLSPQTEIIRGRVESVFAAVIHSAADCPMHGADALARTLYALHLGLMLLYCQERTGGSPSTRAALDLVRDVLALVTPLLGVVEAVPLMARLDAIFTPLLEPPEDPSLGKKAEQMLRVLFRHRRLLPDAGACAEEPCPACLALHLPRLKYFLRAGEPVHFVLPAFPAKSPSRRKVLSPLPDMAEEQALLHLEGVADELARLYPPGARITLCSDGHVFSDLVGVSDEDVSRYGEAIREMLTRLGCRRLDTFNMGDLYEGISFAQMRERLTAEYGVPVEAVQERAHRFEHVRTLVNGIHRFLFEEQQDVHPERSRTQLRQACHDLAYQVVQRSDAWGRLLADCFPTALRLSIHPQPPHSEKIGILLGDAADVWITPWHGVAVSYQGRWRLMKRSDAEDRGALLVEHAGRPSHFVLAQPF
jgi:pyoverdine/dityrosine biosynthesis protein Dit1